MLKKVRKIEIKTRGLSQNIFAGQYHSAFKGRGMAFSEVREYQFGDDVRDIDWNVTARFQRPYVKVFEEERELTVMLLIDVSGSLNFGTSHQLKKDMVTEIAATLAFSAIQNNDKIGVIFFSDRIEKYIPPQKGRKHILYIIREMLDFHPQSNKTDVGMALEFLTRVMKRRCTAFVLSDFYTPDNFDKVLQIANRKHDMVAIQVYDKRAKELPDVGLMLVRDAETGHDMYIDTSSKKLRQAHTRYWLEREDALRQTFAKSNVDWVSVATNDDYVKAMMLLFAQVHVEAKLDSMVILIGQQTRYVVDVTAPKGSKVVFPTFERSQYIAPGVEVLSQRDEAPAEVDGLMRYSKSYLLTSFDEKAYGISNFKVSVNGKKYLANTLVLKVITMDVDTIHPEKFFPPKDVQDNPFMWGEWEPLFWCSFLVLLLASAFFYLVVRLKQNKPIITRIRIVKKVLPHQKALTAIDKLKRDKMASSEDQKAYYTLLTDTLRQYIQERFGFNAREMTSTQILYHLQQNGDQKMIDELRELFQTADLVKFAKYSTLLNENDLNLVNAVNFIDQTKQENVPTEEKIVPTLSDDDKRSRNSRITIKSVMWAVGVAVALLVAYVAYHIYLLTI